MILRWVFLWLRNLARTAEFYFQCPINGRWFDRLFAVTGRPAGPVSEPYSRLHRQFLGVECDLLHARQAVSVDPPRFTSV
jgi:hypothetical protein